MYKKIIKNIFKKFGLEIKKYNPQDDFNFLITKCIKKFQIDCFWDVGANIGLYSIYAGMKFKNIEIICFEPSTSNTRALSRNISINNLYNKIILGEKPAKYLVRLDYQFENMDIKAIY